MRNLPLHIGGTVEYTLLIKNLKSLSCKRVLISPTVILLNDRCTDISDQGKQKFYRSDSFMAKIKLASQIHRDLDIFFLI